MTSTELTLIVAATRKMGIGAHGAMPWQGLRKEMRYFARVTSRLPPQAPAGARNAVIMGRKTWDSIPAQYRPLKDRLNIVLSRSSPATTGDDVDTVRLGSLDEAVQYVEADGRVGRVFVVGGAHVYHAALALPAARRVLLTRIEHDFDCDTFFPLDPATAGWLRRPTDQLRQWAGVEVDDGITEEAGIRYEFQMWERVEADEGQGPTN